MKTRRKFAMIDIITSQRISTQEELCEALRDNGYDVTQATVSRDIKALQLIKIPDDLGYRYALPENSSFNNSRGRMRRLFQDSVVAMDFSENILVIKTLPGTANSIASLIDAADWPQVLGTVAGDDTIFVVVKPLEAVNVIMKEFEALIGS